MKTTNIISTPNIEGNIGTCKVQSNNVQISNTLFTEGYHVVQINSCTGKIITANDYTAYGGLFISLALILVLGLGLFIAIALSSDN